MKKTISTAALLLTAGSSITNAAIITDHNHAAFTGATVESFDNITEGHYNRLDIGGVVIEGINSPIRVLNDINASNFGRNGNALQNYGGNPNSFSITFDSAVDAFGIWGGAYNNAWTWDIFDSHNNLLASEIVSSGTPSSFTGIALSGIKSITLHGNGDWVVFDDLTYNSSLSPVPVPAAAWLFGTALVGFAGWSRRKQKKA